MLPSSQPVWAVKKTEGNTAEALSSFKRKKRGEKILVGPGASERERHTAQTMWEY